MQNFLVDESITILAKETISYRQLPLLIDSKVINDKEGPGS